MSTEAFLKQFCKKQKVRLYSKLLTAYYSITFFEKVYNRLCSSESATEVAELIVSTMLELEAQGQLDSTSRYLKWVVKCLISYNTN